MQVQALFWIEGPESENEIEEPLTTVAALTASGAPAMAATADGASEAPVSVALSPLQSPGAADAPTVKVNVEPGALAMSLATVAVTVSSPLVSYWAPPATRS